MTGATPRIGGDVVRIQRFGPRCAPYLLVIPVLNEGERIRRQLERLTPLLAVDLVIADGGSTDGALDAALLARARVRAVITTRPDLSTQLRAAYAYALAEGYKGVITVDGNDKDDMTAIPAFCARLAEGYDYVQGSRYLPGGFGLNTPRDRELAGRLIHAPLISLAAGRRFTDTTNGFRAYSADFLRRADVAPLRERLRRYSLLFYLSVRAAQLGLRTCEIPVRRAYPASGPTPTKIRAFQGRWTIFVQLLAACFGSYHPRLAR